MISPIADVQIGNLLWRNPKIYASSAKICGCVLIQADRLMNDIPPELHAPQDVFGSMHISDMPTLFFRFKSFLSFSTFVAPVGCLSNGYFGWSILNGALHRF